MSDIQTLMRSANPIEDARTEFGQEDLDALLLLTQRRSGDMDVKELTTPVTPEKRSTRGWLAAVAAAAVVGLVVGAVLLLDRSGDDMAPATTPSTTSAVSPTTTAAAQTTPTTAAGADESPTTTAFVPPELDAEAAAVVEGIIVALDAGDIDAALAPILQADQVVSKAQGFETDQREAIAGRWAYGVEIESTFEPLGCTTTTAGLTRCEFARTSPFDYSSPDPVLSVIQVRLVEGRLAYVQVEPMPGAWGARYDAFGDWIQANHPDALSPLFMDYTDPVASAELTRQYYAEWLASQDS